MAQPPRDSITLHFDAQSLRDHFEGTDRDDELDALTDDQLQAAGELIVNRLSDLFWAAVDDLYIDALSAANDIKES